MEKENVRPIVSISKVKNGQISAAVKKAIDLLGGMAAVTMGKQRIMVKPNAVSDSPEITTKPVVIETLARLMLEAGKDVSIGEASAVADGVNTIGDEIYRTWNPQLLDRMQRQVFDQLGYTELAASLGIPLINLHVGEMVDVPVPNALVFDTIRLHRSLIEIDLLCSVPMMKTHILATVTLGLKNLIGLYPGSVYGAVKASVHDRALERGSPGVACEIIDMVRANKLGLVVIDGTTAMEGDGPSGGELVDMGVIVAGTNPLATDMVAALLMGFKAEEIPTFNCAHQVGMLPRVIDEVEIRGERVEAVQRQFKKPNLVQWKDINQSWGIKVLA